MSELNNSTSQLLSQVRGQIRDIDVAMTETARQGRELLKCDQLADAVRSNVGDPAMGQSINPQALRAMPRNIAGFVDDCAKFRHGYLNAVAGFFRTSGFPLGYQSYSEAFDYFIAASQAGYKEGAIFAGALLTEGNFRDGLSEERLGQLADEYDRHGHNTNELRRASAQFLAHDQRQTQLKAKLVENCRETSTLLRDQTYANDKSVQSSKQRLYTNSKEACASVGVRLSRP